MQLHIGYKIECVEYKYNIVCYRFFGRHCFDDLLVKKPKVATH